MIEIENITKTFGDDIIYKDYCAKIESGAFAVLRGKSGCGKSTMLHMIGGIEKMNGGTIKMDGKDIHKDYGHGEFFGKKVGFLFQNFALVENETVMSNLELIPKKYRTEVTMAEALENVGLSGYETKKIFQLSGGEQQRIALARLMMKQCDVILADEPTGSLDPESAEMVVKILEKMNKDGKTILVVTHSDIFDRVSTQIFHLKRWSAQA